jgi:hypothetical protein
MQPQNELKQLLSSQNHSAGNVAILSFKSMAGVSFILLFFVGAK